MSPMYAVRRIAPGSGRREVHNFHCWTEESLYYGAVGLSKEKKKISAEGDPEIP